MDDNDLNIILDDIKVEVNEENNEPILCESCTKLFDSERKLANHKKYFHELVTSDDYGERLSGQQTLIYHGRNHQTFECETCHKLLDFYNAKRLKTKLQND